MKAAGKQELRKEELEAHDILLAQVLEHLPCGLSAFDSELRHVATNKVARGILQLPQAALARAELSFQALVNSLGGAGTPAGAEPELALGAEAAPGGSRLPARIERTRSDGAVVEIVPCRLPDGTVIAAYNDITESRRAAEELQNNRKRLARALEAAELGLWEYDLPSRQVYLSSGMAGLIGLSQEDRLVTPAQVLRYVPAREMEALRLVFRRLVAGETERMSVEHRVRASDGQEIWFLTESQVSKRAADGRVLKVVGTCKDISQRKKVDAELRAALAAADLASQAKSEFLATMSHEIRTPLNGVIGLTQLLASASLPPMERDSAMMIDSCAKSLLSLVDNILDFSRIEAGRLALHSVPTDLRTLVGELADLFTVQAGEKGIRFQLSLEPGVPDWVMADPGRLRQVLLNLLGNAVKFTAAGGVSLAVRAPAGGDGGQLVFEVRDSGIGIAPEQQSMLFTRFTQVDASATRKYQGTGLGLAISRQLAQLMGGDVTLVSGVGQGATFSLMIPLNLADAPAATDSMSPETLRPDAAILIAEDNEINRLVARMLLERLGYSRITLAANGLEAVALCRAECFDLILMDCQMPEMDGLQATRAIRALGLETPVIAFTASATLGDRGQCLEAGMNDYVTKPVELAVLSQKLRHWLGLSPAAAARPPPQVPPQLTPQDEAVFDRQAMESVFADDSGAFATALRLFERQTGAGLGELRAAVAGGDIGLARRLAHRIRGGAAMLGAPLLAERCREIEDDASGSPATLLEAVDRAASAHAGFLHQAGRAVEDAWPADPGTRPRVRQEPAAAGVRAVRPTAGKAGSNGCPDGCP